MAKKNKIKRSAAAGIPATNVEFNPDYSNTVKDLKRIGILAGSLFAALIVLSFFLN